MLYTSTGTFLYVPLCVRIRVPPPPRVALPPGSPTDRSPRSSPSSPVWVITVIMFLARGFRPPPTDCLSVCLYTSRAFSESLAIIVPKTRCTAAGGKQCASSIRSKEIRATAILGAQNVRCVQYTLLYRYAIDLSIYIM